MEVATSNVEKVEVRLVAPADVSGQVEYDDDAARPPKSDEAQKAVRRILLEALRSGSRGWAQLSEEGHFTVGSMQPDRYRVSLSWPSAYVKSVRANGVELDGAIVDLRNGAGNEGVTIRVSSKVAGISGVVKDDKGPVAGARVFAALEDQVYSRPPVRVLTDANGGYSFTGMPPGKYKVLAVDGENTRPGFNEDYDESAESVEVHAGDRVSRDLKLDTIRPQNECE